MGTKWIFFFILILAEFAIRAVCDESVYSKVESSTEKDVEITVYNGTRHAFFRAMDSGTDPGSPGSRRVFGGSSADLKTFPAVCAILDRYMSVRCSATVISKYWVLTAAHCITPKLAYVKYNTRRPTSNDGNLTAIHYLYRHPKYMVRQADEGRGLDVQTLYHDVGLVRTKDAMKLPGLLPMTATWRRNNPFDLVNKNIKVLGFGRTERSTLGEELFAVDLVLVPCEKEGWQYCVCGVARNAFSRGVCSGDSGGPVLYQGEIIGVTSMGPVECAHSGQSPAVGATSVFTSLYQYSDIINATIEDTEAAMRMRMISQAVIFSPYRILFIVLLILPPWLINL